MDIILKELLQKKRRRDDTIASVVILYLNCFLITLLILLIKYPQRKTKITHINCLEKINLYNTGINIKKIETNWKQNPKEIWTPINFLLGYLKTNQTI